MKKYTTIACCGIDCGLCPQYHSKAASACPGCGGETFKEKHPSCGFVTCCVEKKGLETCAACSDFPCKRFDKEDSGLDSFVTHRKVFSNLSEIKQFGLPMFLDKQRDRMSILSRFLDEFDDGRSKSFFCLSCTLLPIEILQECLTYASSLDTSLGVKPANKTLKSMIQSIADDLHIELKLNHKPAVKKG